MQHPCFSWFSPGWTFTTRNSPPYFAQQDDCFTPHFLCRWSCAEYCNRALKITIKHGDHVPATDTEAMKTIKLRDITTQLNDCVAPLAALALQVSWIMAKRWRIILNYPCFRSTPLRSTLCSLIQQGKPANFWNIAGQYLRLSQTSNRCVANGSSWQTWCDEIRHAVATCPSWRRVISRRKPCEKRWFRCHCCSRYVISWLDQIF